MFELKRLSPDAIPAAIEKALRYRLLNDPEQATSICEDVLQIDPDNQQALTTLILSMTERFNAARPVSPKAAQDLLPRLRDPYEREYFAGIIFEREAHARLQSNAPRSGSAAFECFRQAMQCFERAEAIRPPANDDALLRWNSCARMIMNNPDVQAVEETQELAATLGE
jgi:tetratricopeptide (TPR) repeat protein